MASLTNWPWQHWATRGPDQAALTVEDVDWPWQRVVLCCNRLAVDFIQQGVKPDAIVAIRGKNSVPMLLSYLALLQCGARVLPLNPQLPDTLVSTLLPRLNVDHILCLPLSSCLSAGDLPPALNVLFYPAEDAVFYPAEPSATDAVDIGVPWESERLATLTLTSGSSGSPKAAAHRFSAHIASAEGVAQMVEFTANHRWLLSLPLFHVSGQGIVWRWLSVGGTLVIRPNQPLEQGLQGCTHASLVPTQLWRLLAEGTVPSTLNAVLLGGAAIPLTMTQQAEAQGVRCWCGYGLTEMASTVCAKRANGQAGVGLPLPQREIKLVDGEIVLRGPCLAAGYWRDGELTPLAQEDGWFHTRDSATFQQNEWHILGRLDNQFISGGEGVQPENIEAILLAHPGVLQACVVPVEDPEFGHRPVAVLDLAQDATLPMIRDWLAPQLAGFQRPVAYLALPTALMGSGIKLARPQVKAWAQEIYREGGAEYVS